MSIAKLSYAGVDYLTVTRSDHLMYGEWQEMMLPERIEEQGAGRKEHLRWLQGYYGPVGEHFFYGRGEQGSMLRLSGALAGRYFSRDCLRDARCSRIDIQVTSAPPISQDSYLHESYQRVQWAHAGRGRPPEVQLIDTNNGAKMLTIGSRQSAVYARCYDKEKESKDERYKGMVRLELEIKRPESEGMFSFLRQDALTVFHVKHIITDYFEKRGMEMFFKDYELTEPPAIEKRTKTDATRLGWIASQVAPTVAKLVENGKQWEVAAALLPKGSKDAKIRQMAELLASDVDS